MKVPETHSGQEAIAMHNFENSILEQVILDSLLEQLSREEQEIISLWAHRYTYKEISLYVTMVYGGKPTKKPISPSAIGTRIKKILEKLRKLAKVE